MDKPYDRAVIPVNCGVRWGNENREAVTVSHVSRKLSGVVAGVADPGRIQTTGLNEPGYTCRQIHSKSFEPA